MFDNLKDKLGSFRKDVEETAEEKAEPVDEDEFDEGELDEGELRDEELDETELDDPTSASDEDGAATDRSPATAEAERAPDDAPEAEVDADAEVETDAENHDAIDPKQPKTTDRPWTTDPDDVASTPESADEGAGATGNAEAGSGAAASADRGDGSAPEPEPTDEPETDESSGGSTGFGRKAKSLVRGKFVIEEEDLEGPLQELELALLSSDVEMTVAEEILDNIRDELVGETRRFTESTGGVVEQALRDAILDVISVGQFDFDERIAAAEKPLVIIFTGVNGVGKTTSIAKLSRYLEARGFSNVMANGDTYRAGANEQIREHAEALDTKLIAHDQGGDPAAVLYDAVEYAEAHDVDVVLGDTAGRLHTNEDLMAQLEKIERVVGPDMTLFVDEAVAGQDAVNRARKFDDAATIDGAILTKADADSNGGAAISVAHVTGKPILFLGVGQGYDDLERFDPDRMVDRLLDED